MSSGFDVPQDIFRGYPDNHLATYLFRLPFGLGLDPSQAHVIQTIDIDAAAAGRPEAESVTQVNFKFARLPIAGQRYFPENLTSAMRHFYGDKLPSIDFDARFSPENAYELWVSAETPLARLPHEPDIPACTFERCLRALDILLRAYRLAIPDRSVYPVGPAAMTKTVPVGIRDVDGQWQFLIMLFVRPEAGLPGYPQSATPQQLSRFASIVQGLAVRRPFLRGMDLEQTAYRQAYAHDDLNSAIVSLQTAMESTLFELWHLTMVDSDMTRSDIEALVEADKPFKTLVTTTLPSILGGSWDVSAQATTVGRYWRHLYLLRNDVVHSGAVVQEWQLDNAYAAYSQLMRFLAKQLRTKWRKCPRTVAAFSIARGFPPESPLSSMAKAVVESILSESKPFWLPRDSATGHTNQNS